MTSLFHSLHIGTLATWLSVAGFGTVAVIVPNRPAAVGHRPEAVETQWLPPEITLGGERVPAAVTTSLEKPAVDSAAPLAAPPEMPELTELAPLPELPAAVAAARQETPPPPKPAAPGTTAARSARPAGGKPVSAGNPGATPGGQAGGASGMSSAARLAAGNMPAPAYPAESRRLGQTGTLVVEFTVDATGRVISAYAITPSPWPLLNQEAVRTVRHWKFPPGGGVMKLQRPIVFQLR